MLRLAAVTVTQDARYSRLAATVERDRGREPVELTYEYSRDSIPFLQASADPLVPALLIPCMARSEPLEIVPPISAKLHAALDTIQTIMTQWWPELRRVPVSATQRHGGESSTVTRMESASFFSGGVDSLYTCLKHAAAPRSAGSPRLTHIVHMEGVEKPLEESTDSRPLRDDIRRTAEHYGVQVVFGRTNMRTVFPLQWSRYYHGAGLASVGLSLSATFGRILIPSTHTFRHLFPWGSHPLLDPLWSTESTEIVHDGCEATRVEKTALIASDPYALAHVRVCLRNAAGTGNCGRCKKCMRTMVTLAALGALSSAGTFPNHLPDDYDEILPLGEANDRAFVEEILSYLEEREPASPMAKALSHRLRESRRRAAGRDYVHNSRLEGMLPTVRRLRGAAVRLASIIGHFVG